MKYRVIAAFIDKRNGEQIEPGSPVPEGLDEETIERLINARCLKPAGPIEPLSNTNVADGEAGGGDPGGTNDDGADGEAPGGQTGDTNPDGTGGATPAGQAGKGKAKR